MREWRAHIWCRQSCWGQAEPWGQAAPWGQVGHGGSGGRAHNVSNVDVKLSYSTQGPRGRQALRFRGVTDLSRGITFLPSSSVEHHNLVWHAK